MAEQIRTSPEATIKPAAAKATPVKRVTVNKAAVTGPVRRSGRLAVSASATRH